MRVSNERLGDLGQLVEQCVLNMLFAWLMLRDVVHTGVSDGRRRGGGMGGGVGGEVGLVGIILGGFD